MSNRGLLMGRLCQLSRPPFRLPPSPATTEWKKLRGLSLPLLLPFACQPGLTFHSPGRSPSASRRPFNSPSQRPFSSLSNRARLSIPPLAPSRVAREAHSMASQNPSLGQGPHPPISLDAEYGSPSDDGSDVLDDGVPDGPEPFVDTPTNSESKLASRSDPSSIPTESCDGDGSTTTTSLGCWSDYLILSDSDLLKQCEMDTYRASGPGGQHRNKTDSAVRLRHKPTGITTQSCEERSQHINRLTALKRLKQNIALKLRSHSFHEKSELSIELIRILPRNSLSKSHGSIQRIGPNHPDFILGAAHLLDILHFYRGSISQAAQKIGISTGTMSKLITSEKSTHQAVNNLRSKFGLKPLR